MPVFAFLCVLLFTFALESRAQEVSDSGLGLRGPQGVVLLWGDDEAPPASLYVVERAEGARWVRITPSPLGVPATLEATRVRVGEDTWDELRRAYRAESDEALFNAMQSFTPPSGLLSLFNAEVGLLLGRRFLDTSAPAQGPLRYRILRVAPEDQVLVAQFEVSETPPELENPRHVQVVLDSLMGPIVQFSRSPSPSALTYQVYREDAMGNRVAVTAFPIVLVAPEEVEQEDSVFDVVDSSAEPGATYIYSAHAADLAGNESPGVRTPPLRIPFPVPSGVTGVQAYTTPDGRVLVQWDPVEDAFTVALHVFRSDDPAVLPEPLPGALLPATQLVWEDLEPVHGATHLYLLVALGVEGRTSSPSEIARVDVPAMPRLRVQGLTANAHPEGVSLDWVPLPDTTVRYTLFRLSTPEDTLGVRVQSNLRSPTTVDTLGAGQFSWYQVGATDATGTDYVRSASVPGLSGRKLFDGRPPHGLVLQTGTALLLTWQAPAGDYPLSYQIFREGTPVGETPQRITAWVDTLSGFPAFYNVLARYEQGEAVSDTLFLNWVSEPDPMPIIAAFATVDSVVVQWYSTPSAEFRLWSDHVEEGSIHRADVTTGEDGNGFATFPVANPGAYVYVWLTDPNDSHRTTQRVLVRVPLE